MHASHASCPAFRDAFRTRPVTRLSLARDREPLQSSSRYLTKTKVGYVLRAFTALGLGASNG